MAILSISNLSKKYSKKIDYAVSNLSFEVGGGEIVGLLGHNGAGKSTTLKCLTGMLPFESGQILIKGNCIQSEPLKAKASFGFVSDNHALFEKMTGKEYLNFMADIYQVKQDIRLERIERLQEILKFGKLNNIISSYSHGMKQKICLMGSILHNPPLWVLDEPLIGLDTTVVESLKSFIIEYATEDSAVLFSTHQIDFVQKVCTRAVIIREGLLTHDVMLSEFRASKNSFEKFALQNIGG